MRIVFLNTWHGNTGVAFEDFIREYAPDTDFFFLQEATDRVVSLCRDALPRHEVMTAHREYEGGEIRQATLSTPSARLVSSDVLFLDRTDVGLGLYTEIAVGDTTLHVVNFHGASQPGDKLDNPERLSASQGIIDFMAGKSGLKIIGGDFNLLPETQSVRMFTDAGYVDHIKKNGITTTRNRLAWGRYPEHDRQYFADYVFTSPDVVVQRFEVIDNEASDHLPLVLDIVTA